MINEEKLAEEVVSKLLFSSDGYQIFHKDQIKQIFMSGYKAGEALSCVDLGLPSGKLWKNKPEEGYYTFDEAKEKFGKDLPTKEDFKELVENTKHEWDWNKNGMVFTGKNGNELFLPANGYRDKSNTYLINYNGYYWSSTPDKNIPYCAYVLCFGRNDIAHENSDNRCLGQSAILVI